jgi:hypothetical protein
VKLAPKLVHSPASLFAGIGQVRPLQASVECGIDNDLRSDFAPRFNTIQAAPHGPLSGLRGAARAADFSGPRDGTITGAGGRPQKWTPFRR